MPDHYGIVNMISGADLGVFEGDSSEAALDAFARESGYRDLAHSLEVTGDTLESSGLRAVLLVF